MRVLVVEDEVALRDSLKERLAESGFTVDVASDGEEAVATVQQKPYDLVLMNAHAENGRRLGDHDDPQDRRAGAAGADRRIDRQCAGRSARMLPRRRDE